MFRFSRVNGSTVSRFLVSGFTRWSPCHRPTKGPRLCEINFGVPGFPVIGCSRFPAFTVLETHYTVSEGPIGGWRRRRVTSSGWSAGQFIGPRACPQAGLPAIVITLCRKPGFRGFREGRGLTRGHNHLRAGQGRFRQNDRRDVHSR